MLIDYTTLILKEYRKKQIDGTLSSNLMQPTPANLRTECLTICGQQFLKKDEKVLKDFFGQFENVSGCLKLIDSFDVSKFKALINYLKGTSSETNLKNMELLAWLIDFEPRPFVYGKKYSEVDIIVDKIQKEPKEVTPAKDQPDDKTVPIPIPVGDDDEKEIQEPRNRRTFFILPKVNFKKKKAIIPTSLVLFSGIGLFFLLPNKNNTPTILNTPLPRLEKCMYWKDYHYNTISCNEKFTDSINPIPLDSVRLVYFKEITRPDTITIQAMGSLRYVKRNNIKIIEFYTMDGPHPTDPSLRLRPLSIYIFKKYILPLKENPRFPVTF